MPQLIVHVGMPKCGSTFLQKSIFPFLHDTLYVANRDGYGSVEDFSFSKAVSAKEFYASFSRKLEARDIIYKPAFQEIQNLMKAHARPVLLSTENFVMPGNCMRMNIPGSELRDSLEPSDIISVLKSLSDDVRIVLIIRRQWDWLGSWYQERVKRYETRKFSDMIANNDFAEILSRLDYCKVITQYTDAFGSENVKVIPFELLASDPQEFNRRIRLAIGDLTPSALSTRHKTGLSRPFVHLKRLANSLLVFVGQATGGYSKILLFLSRLFKYIARFDGILRKLFGKFSTKKTDLPRDLQIFFEEKNFELEKKYRLGLGELGYWQMSDRNMTNGTNKRSLS